MEIIVDLGQKRVLVDGVQMYVLRRNFGLYDLRDMQGYYVQTGLLKPEIESAVRRLLGNMPKNVWKQSKPTAPIWLHWEYCVPAHRGCVLPLTDGYLALVELPDGSRKLVSEELFRDLARAKETVRAWMENEQNGYNASARPIRSVLRRPARRVQAAG